MSKRDYYETLAVSKNATEADIKKSFRRLAMKFHPDRNPGDADAEANFKEAKEAYDVLSDSRKRSAYDQFGHAGVDQQFGGGAGGGALAGDSGLQMLIERWPNLPDDLKAQIVAMVRSLIAILILIGRL